MSVTEPISVDYQCATKSRSASKQSLIVRYVFRAEFNVKTDEPPRAGWMYLRAGFGPRAGLCRPLFYDKLLQVHCTKSSSSTSTSLSVAYLGFMQRAAIVGGIHLPVGPTAKLWKGVWGTKSPKSLTIFVNGCIKFWCSGGEKKCKHTVIHWNCTLKNYGLAKGGGALPNGPP